MCRFSSKRQRESAVAVERRAALDAAQRVEQRLVTERDVTIAVGVGVVARRRTARIAARRQARRCCTVIVDSVVVIVNSDNGGSQHHKQYGETTTTTTSVGRGQVATSSLESRRIVVVVAVAITIDVVGHRLANDDVDAANAVGNVARRRCVADAHTFDRAAASRCRRYQSSRLFCICFCCCCCCCCCGDDPLSFVRTEPTTVGSAWRRLMRSLARRCSSIRSSIGRSCCSGPTFVNRSRCRLVIMIGRMSCVAFVTFERLTVRIRQRHDLSRNRSRCAVVVCERMRARLIVSGC
jgi:hypothetical protein